MQSMEGRKACRHIRGHGIAHEGIVTAKARTYPVAAVRMRYHAKNAWTQKAENHETPGGAQAEKCQRRQASERSNHGEAAEKHDAMES